MQPLMETRVREDPSMQIVSKRKPSWIKEGAMGLPQRSVYTPGPALGHQPGRMSGRIATWIEHGRNVIEQESRALSALAMSLDESFADAVGSIVACTGSLVLCGIGKAGLIAGKLSATFASTGTPSYFLHPSEAIHGDLGRLRANDIVLVLSWSGETEEITRILPSLRNLSSRVIAITGKKHSQLGRESDLVLELPAVQEACDHRLAPSTSTTAMLAMGDALALVVSRERAFTPQDFARFHPGGSLGRRLSTVEQMMRPLSECRVAHESESLRWMLIHSAKKGRRSGAVMLTNDQGKLCGIFTDSDLARLLESRREDTLDQPIHAVMTRNFTAIQSGARFEEAIEVLAGRKISELPVVDEEDRPKGMIDITDVVGMIQTGQSVSGTREETNGGGVSSLRLFRG